MNGFKKNLPANERYLPFYKEGCSGASRADHYVGELALMLAPEHPNKSRLNEMSRALENIALELAAMCKECEVGEGDPMIGPEQDAETSWEDEVHSREPPK